MPIGARVDEGNLIAEVGNGRLQKLRPQADANPAFSPESRVRALEITGAQFVSLKINSTFARTRTGTGVAS